MLIFILLIFSIYALCFFVKRKYNNPYKCIFIFGKKGSGKSTYMVKQMLKHKKRGWIIYTDMKSCTIPGVRIIEAKSLEIMTLPKGSCLFLEEVGLTYNNRKFKTMSDGVIEFYKYLRQYEIKCYMNSQAFDVDKKIRDTTDNMLLITSILDCISIVRPVYITVVLTDPVGDSESRIAFKLKFARIWKWEIVLLPRYHKYFKSFNPPPRDEISYIEVPKLSNLITD